jgi:hypothetical protein
MTMNNTILKIPIILMLFISCDADEQKQKQTQSIDFGELAPQLLSDGYLQLQATASSGLSVSFSSDDTRTVVIEGNKAVFKQAGKVNIIAYQSGNEQFYEAPEIRRQLIVRDWDRNKKTQEINFELPAEWKLSRDNQTVELKATASSGLPVDYSLSTDKYGRILASDKSVYLYFYHAGESGTPGDNIYDVHISVTASQSGNDEYNPADNVECTIHVIGDVFH